jgi:eukaryotic-like serine/threonine-protein kinase
VAGPGEHGRVFRGRYAGWVVLAVVTPMVVVAGVAVARGAVGDAAVTGALTPAQVSAELSGIASSRPAHGSTQHPNPPASLGPAMGPTVRPSASGSSQVGPTHPSGPATSGPGPTSASQGPTPSTGPTSAPNPTATPSPSPTPHSRLLTSTGGSVVAQCSGSGYRTVYLVSWSPAQGYQVNGTVRRGPGQEAEIEFESDRQSVTMHVYCRNGYPVSGGEAGDD